MTDDPRIEKVACWLERLADSREQSSRGALGQMLAATKADAWREAAGILRQHPEVIDRE